MTLPRALPLVTLTAWSLSVVAAPRLVAQGAETAVFAGGCFWGIEAVFEHTRGVISAVSGFAGGSLKRPSYDDVSEGGTGHAESVRVTYDPSQIGYGQLLEIFFLVHDPTQLNRQGPDIGTQYRSVVFYGTAEQRHAVEELVAQLAAAKRWPGPIVTALEPLGEFYEAEPYHQHYLTKHPTQPYIVYNDLPKLALFRRTFPALYRESPVN